MKAITAFVKYVPPQQSLMTALLDTYITL